MHAAVNVLSVVGVDRARMIAAGYAVRQSGRAHRYSVGVQREMSFSHKRLSEQAEALINPPSVERSLRGSVTTRYGRECRQAR